LAFIVSWTVEVNNMPIEGSEVSTQTLAFWVGIACFAYVFVVAGEPICGLLKEMIPYSIREKSRRR
jgi:hypothetical protein